MQGTMFVAICNEKYITGIYIRKIYTVKEPSCLWMQRATQKSFQKYVLHVIFKYNKYSSTFEIRRGINMEWHGNLIGN